MEKSIFTQIIEGNIPAKKLYEDDIVIAIYDAFPQTEGHFLVIPKSQEQNILLNDENTYLHALKVARKLAQEHVIDQGIPGFKLLINTGKTAGQVVMHTHIHIIPYRETDKLTSKH
ncbi:histidine triad protein HinT [Mycoplasma nasistruthionis]|nr:HIT family protein [Mycoplasma nasistruthionis]